MYKRLFAGLNEPPLSQKEEFMGRNNTLDAGTYEFEPPDTCPLSADYYCNEYDQLAKM